MTTILPVGDDQWEIVAWLWQSFRHDLSPVVGGLPYADGRYGHQHLDQYPTPDGLGYLAWAPHPVTGEDAPVGFALVARIGSGRCAMLAFWVATPLRRTGLGRELALDVIGRHDGPWEIAFQDANLGAARFWRQIATEAWASAWAETVEPVPGKPDVAPDHWIRTH